MAPRRGTKRGRKVSERMAIVDEDDRKFAQQARLDALEDGVDGDALAVDDDDEEFDIEDEMEMDVSSKKSAKRKAGVKKKVRRFNGRHAQASFAVLLEESGIYEGKVPEPHYLSAQTGEEKVRAPRKFCAICGDFSGYRCARCGERYCSKRCYLTHNELRCLKFGLQFIFVSWFVLHSGCHVVP
eukprot:TRINITY_DN10990_c0_g1_i12.p3 TRINITY_DN10990_c0_g1~~TRINITY_DN10990_c0_g1_i12.p3  ORF type:complete len:184 (-),score=27.50 TRINITY_DN10990_c0_g1_i12:441-992(-)